MARFEREAMVTAASAERTVLRFETLSKLAQEHGADEPVEVASGHESEFWAVSHLTHTPLRCSARRARGS